MYYTTSSGYRKTRMVIDYATIVLTVVMAVMFIAVLVLREGAGILFPLIFLAGAVVNGMGAVKKHIEKQKVICIIQTVVMALALIMAGVCFCVVM